jgi:hypothetical protein
MLMRRARAPLIAMCLSPLGLGLGFVPEVVHGDAHRQASAHSAPAPAFELAVMAEEHAAEPPHQHLGYSAPARRLAAPPVAVMVIPSALPPVVTRETAIAVRWPGTAPPVSRVPLTASPTRAPPAIS